MNSTIILKHIKNSHTRNLSYQTKQMGTKDLGELLMTVITFFRFHQSLKFRVY